jgi:hypothetical protein
MAQEFRQWDKVFSRQEIVQAQHDWRSISKTHGTNFMDMKGWTRFVQYWTHEQVREVVYLTHDAADWQLFRVSLKGLSTLEKLRLLEGAFKEYVEGGDNEAVQQKWKCRIDNYIGALVRGGQLNKKLEIVR